MSISISVSIMAHPKRRKFVSELTGQLDRKAEVVWDRRNDRWDTGSRAMLAYDPNCSHHMVLQDDTIVCRDLCAGVESALKHLSIVTNDPTPMGLYIGRLFKRQARMYDTAEISWFTMPLRWGVGIVMPTRLIDDAVGWGNKHKAIANYDLRLSQWLRTQGLLTWHPWPSMVDHRLTPSLVPERGVRGRYATKFLGADASALDHDWTGNVIHRLDRVKYVGAKEPQNQ